MRSTGLRLWKGDEVRLLSLNYMTFLLPKYCFWDDSHEETSGPIQRGEH